MEVKVDLPGASDTGCVGSATIRVNERPEAGRAPRVAVCVDNSDRTPRTGTSPVAGSGANGDVRAGTELREGTKEDETVGTQLGTAETQMETVKGQPRRASTVDQHERHNMVTRSRARHLADVPTQPATWTQAKKARRSGPGAAARPTPVNEEAAGNEPNLGSASETPQPHAWEPAPRRGGSSQRTAAGSQARRKREDNSGLEPRPTQGNRDAVEVTNPPLYSAGKIAQPHQLRGSGVRGSEGELGETGQGDREGDEGLDPPCAVLASGSSHTN